MVVAWVLIVWWGSGPQQTSIAVDGIATERECQRLGGAISRGKYWPQVECHSYQTIEEK